MSNLRIVIENLEPHHKLQVINEHMCIFINMTLPLIVNLVVYKISAFEVPAMLECKYPIVRTSALPQ